MIMENMRRLHNAPDDELTALLSTDAYDRQLIEAADQVRREIYGTDVYIRGLIEFTNYCKNNCYYCGIRRGHQSLARYRLSREEILDCCETGYALGFRTFVLQGGEDPFYTDSIVCGIVSGIKEKYPDCAVTLSLGERQTESYQAFRRAGADRYLLRHESADDGLYRLLHPEDMRLENRMACLYTLKDLGYQVGAGFMVGAPYQTLAHILKDIRFLQTLQPAMIGIGPFLRHHATPFQDHENGSLTLTLRLIAVLRLLFPYALIPATTALGSIAPDGRERGLMAGANVVMPNLSPQEVRHRYALYDNKVSIGAEAAETKAVLVSRVRAAGYQVVTHRGDVKTSAP